MSFSISLMEGDNERAAKFVYPSFSAHNSCYPMYILCSIFFFIDSLPILERKYPNPIRVLQFLKL